MKSNLLGDIRAENDADMLQSAFLETNDYRTLLESSDRTIVVGRRGAGKSAMVHRLRTYWKQQSNTTVIIIAPEEDQMIGLRGLLEVFGDNYVHVKAGAKIAWRYALTMELISRHYRNYRNKGASIDKEIEVHLKIWSTKDQTISEKIRRRIKEVVDKSLSPEENIADLAANIGLKTVLSHLQSILDSSKQNSILLIDRLDEGYYPDPTGIALVDGFVQAAIDMNSMQNDNSRTIVFLRDNIFRSIRDYDPDFTRNTEGQVMRLHWDAYQLFNLICKRIIVAKNLSQESHIKVWNSVTAKDLKGREGFALALRLTLYRPRDILVLLNNAFLHAANQGRDQIVLEDIESTAKTISDTRLQDLLKEYESVLPALALFIGVFYAKPTELTVAEATRLIDGVMQKDDVSFDVRKSLAFFDSSTQVLQNLYGIGFVGMRMPNSSSLDFCHDGKEPAKEITEDASILIHPCYWLALNLIEGDIELYKSDDIHHEYDIEISSVSTEQLNRRIGRLIEDIKTIDHGSKDSHNFEEWCHNAVKLVFAGALTNVELHPNISGRQQRDIVATNMGAVPVWRRIQEDYKCRQVVFEVKNYTELTQDDYRQMNTYLTNEHGSIGFFVTRAANNNLEKGKELDWAQEMYFNQGKKIMIKISAHYLSKHLSKLRGNQKHDAANIELNKLVDTYIRRYLIMKAK